MAQSKKYGTFAAVFTPSFLTVIGAIMYLRLGWIVGQAGIYKTLLIIVVAHIISFATGLSVSSISTDKKIKSGGVYYILSRSLGLPMGGAIGIAITLAMILAIALQVVAFSESLMSIESVAAFLNLEPGIHAYRIIGTVALIAVATIAFISTSSALKSQFFMLGAIGLSLISIALGFIINTDFHPMSPSLNPIDSQVPFMMLFGIFFPAATGFTTGVAMSGDLKDPKKSIPIGVMGAIIAGFVIYVALTIGFGLFVERNILLDDLNFVTKIAWNPALVYLGIWCATLPTILGLILAAPRILQAIAGDKILPKIFAKSHGKNNEPRNAMIFIVIAAWLAVMIGELNVIAPINAMFFLVSYIFINLAFVLEKWSSTDFRPTFKVSTSVGIIGFLASFIVMFELNKIAMLVAFIIMIALYLYIKRKNLALEYGDVWQSVLLSITRNSLRKISKRKLENRNWQPNIIVFSGGNKTRPHLVDFGKWLIGKHGFLSNFDLRVVDSDKPVMPISDDFLNSDEKTDQWIEAKTYQCRNVYDGIETLSNTYGFTGIEPNTIILGFDSSTPDPERFGLMLSNLSKLNKNILLMRFNNTKTFGDKKNIDIWISPEEQDVTFSLNLVKLLWTNENWYNSALRINVISNSNSASSFVFNKLSTIINQMRIVADIRVISNGVENKAIHSLINEHSEDSDLIFTALPYFEKNTEEAYAHIIDVCKVEKTIIFVKGSKDFLTLGNFDIISKHFKNKKDKEQDFITPLRPEVADFVLSLRNDIAKSVEKSITAKTDVLETYFSSLLKNITKTISNNDENDASIFIADSFKLELKELINSLVSDFEPVTTGIGNELLSEINSIRNNIPKPFITLYDKNLSEDTPEDTKDLLKLKKKIRKFYAKSSNADKLYQYKSDISKQISYHLFQMYCEILNEVYKQIKQVCFNYYYGLIKILSLVDDAHSDTQKKSLIKEINAFNKQLNNSLHNIHSQVNNFTIAHINEITSYLNIINYGDISVDYKGLANKTSEVLANVNDEFKALSQILPCILNRLIVGADLIITKAKLLGSVDEINTGISDYINNTVLFKHQSFLKSIKSVGSSDNIDINENYGIDNNFELLTLMNESYDKIAKVIQIQTNAITIIKNEPLALYEISEEETPLHFEFSASRTIDYTLQNYFYKQVKSLLSEMIQYSQNSVAQHKTFVTQLTFADDFKSSVKNVETQINLEVGKLNDKVSSVKNEVNIIYGETCERLLLEAFIANIEHIKSIANVGSIFHKKERIKILPQKISQFFRENITQFWYKRSAGRNYTNFLVERDSNQERMRKYLHDIAKVTMPQDIEQSLSYTYKQLFTSSQHYNKDLWVGKTKEINDFKILLAQYYRLRNGAIMITGDIGVGKSFFSHHVAKTYVSGAQVFTIKSVAGGSFSVNKFERAVIRAVDAPHTATLNEAIESAPKNSVFIFDNIEQWWHRNEGGNNAINKLFSLIETYSKDYLFILSANKIGLNALSLTTNINQVLIGSVSLSPFNAQELETIIMRRHKAGNYTFVLNGKNEANFHQWNYAKLFTVYYRFTDGNINSALKLWLSCIDKVSEEEIYIHEPKLPESIPFQLLSRQQIIFLAQLIIHNSMSLERIFATSKRPMSEVKQDINALLRFGLIEKVSENIFAVNTVLYPFIVSGLKQIEII